MVSHYLPLGEEELPSTAGCSRPRPSSPPPAHITQRQRTNRMSGSAKIRAAKPFAVASTRRLTDPTPAASTPAATAVAPEPTKREAMPNALNGIATAAPLLPRRNNAIPAAACAALAAAHHGHLSASPPPPRSSISAAVTRVFGDRFSCWSWHSIQPENSLTCGARMKVSNCQTTDMWDRDTGSQRSAEQQIAVSLPPPEYSPTPVTLGGCDQGGKEQNGGVWKTVFQNHSILNTSVYKCHDISSVCNTIVLEYHNFEYIKVFTNKVYSALSSEIPGEVATWVATFPWKGIPGRRNAGKRKSEKRGYAKEQS